VAHLEARLHAAWKARHQAPNHREVIGKLLPEHNWAVTTLAPCCADHG
jgi:hypothetical protein